MQIFLINSARLSAQRYAMSYAKAVPLEQLVQICVTRNKAMRGMRGLRPFGLIPFRGIVRLLCPSCFVISDDRLRPSNSLTGTRVLGFSCTVILGKLLAGWTAAAIGANSQAAQAILKDRVHRLGMTIAAARKLAMKVLKQTMDSTLLQPEKVEMS